MQAESFSQTYDLSREYDQFLKSNLPFHSHIGRWMAETVPDKSISYRKKKKNTICRAQIFNNIRNDRSWNAKKKNILLSNVRQTLCTRHSTVSSDQRIYSYIFFLCCLPFIPGSVCTIWQTNGIAMNAVQNVGRSEIRFCWYFNSQRMERSENKNTETSSIAFGRISGI